MKNAYGTFRAADLTFILICSSPEALQNAKTARNERKRGGYKSLSFYFRGFGKQVKLTKFSTLMERPEFNDALNKKTVRVFSNPCYIRTIIYIKCRRCDAWH